MFLLKDSCVNQVNGTRQKHASIKNPTNIIIRFSSSRRYDRLMKYRCGADRLSKVSGRPRNNCIIVIKHFNVIAIELKQSDVRYN